MPHTFYTLSTVTTKYRPRPRAWHSSSISLLYFVTPITMRGLRLAWRCCWRFKSFGMWGSVVSVWRVVPQVSKDRDHFVCLAMEKRDQGCSKRRRLATHRQSTTSPNTWTFKNHNIVIHYICRKLQSSLSNKNSPTPKTQFVSVFIVFHTQSSRPASPNLSHRNSLKEEYITLPYTELFLRNRITNIEYTYSF